MTMCVTSTGWMSGSNFTSPSAEVAEINRIHYELEYTEGISQRMRIPETLKVAADKPPGSLAFEQPLHVHSTMQVPERIVVAGEDGWRCWCCGELIFLLNAYRGWKASHEPLPVTSLPLQVTIVTLCSPIHEIWIWFSPSPLWTFSAWKRHPVSSRSQSSHWTPSKQIRRRHLRAIQARL